jgi:hypothetical protein
MSMSPTQLKQLGIAASAAVKHQRMVGVFEVPPDMRGASKTAQNEFWRHQQVALATQRVCSFKDMADLRSQGGADEYQLVMQHFEALAGPFWKEKATTRTGKLIDGADCDRAPGCEYVRDMNPLARQGRLSARLRFRHRQGEVQRHHRSAPSAHLATEAAP